MVSSEKVAREYVRDLLMTEQNSQNPETIHDMGELGHELLRFNEKLKSSFYSEEMKNECITSTY